MQLLLGPQGVENRLFVGQVTISG